MSGDQLPAIFMGESDGSVGSTIRMVGPALSPDFQPSFITGSHDERDEDAVGPDALDEVVEFRGRFAVYGDAEGIGLDRVNGQRDPRRRSAG
jgi:hypothetical protein